MFKDKKLLVLGGKPIGSVELVQRAKELGIYVIVTDYLPKEQSPAKLIADESWDISTADVDMIAEKCKGNKINGILTAVHEFNINRMIDLCEILNLPCYCNRDTWKYCDSKVEFKQLCISNNVPVAKKYDIDIKDVTSLEQLPYPVIVKPVDGSGSRGFKICYDKEELIEGYNNALNFSPGNKILVEDFIPYDAVIIHYTMLDGKCYFSGISDKYSCTFPSTGASVMGLQLFPSKGFSNYVSSMNEKVCKMFENAHFTNGPIWIEAFYDGKEKFIFNEMGYRFGGSLTNYPVKYFYGIDQLDSMLSVSLNEKESMDYKFMNPDKQYCILPIHIKAGMIKNVSGLDIVKDMPEVNALVQVHYIGDCIKDWGSAQQVFCYLHVVFSNFDGLKNSLSNVMNSLKVFDENNENMLFTLFDINSIH